MRRAACGMRFHGARASHLASQPVCLQVGYEVKVSVERGGVVGGEGRKEPSRVLFNLDCEELRMGVPLRVWHMAVVAVPALMLLIAFMLATALRRGEEGDGIRAPKMRSQARVREVPP